jgi:hypothetical protein
MERLSPKAVFGGFQHKIQASLTRRCDFHPISGFVNRIKAVVAHHFDFGVTEDGFHFQSQASFHVFSSKPAQEIDFMTGERLGVGVQWQAAAAHGNPLNGDLAEAEKSVAFGQNLKRAIREWEEGLLNHENMHYPRDFVRSTPEMFNT